MRSLSCLLLGLLLSSATAAESPDEQIFADLRARGLFEQAEAHGIKEWQRGDLSDRRRADLAIQLALTYTEHALASPPEARGPLWKKADDVCSAFVERWPANPRRMLVELQRALAAYARGEQLREEAAAPANPATGPVQPIEQLRAAVREFERLSQTVESHLNSAARPATAAGTQEPLSASKLESLARHISLYAARAQRQLGLCYPERSADRDDSMLQAVERLEPLAQQVAPDEVAWHARVEIIACLRELNRREQARKYLYDWRRDNPPPDIATRLSAQRIQLLLADGKINEAIQVARRQDAATTDDKTALAELACARLEAAVADWKRSQHTDRKLDATELAAYADAIGREYGPRWQRKAQTLVGDALASIPADADAKSLLLAAQELYHRGQMSDALQNFDRVATILRRQNSDQALEVAMTAAALERKSGHLASAAERYRQWAVNQPGHPRAAEAHRLAILCVADVMRESAPADQQALATPYEQMLHDHLERWPNDKSADEVRLWLGQLLVNRREWSDARDVLAAIDPASESFAPATSLRIACYESELAQFDQAADAEAAAKRAVLLAAATQQLQPIITGPENHWPTTWTAVERDAALGLSRLHLDYSTGPSHYVERLLTATLRGTPEAGQGENVDSQRQAAQCMLIVALARNNKAVEALKLVDDLDGVSPQQLMETVHRLFILGEQASEISDEERRALGELCLSVLQLLDPHLGDLEPSVVATLNKSRAWALAATGNQAAAVALYAKLIEDAPRDGHVRRQYAEVLTASDSPLDLQKALAEWQQIEEHTRRGKPRWRRARQARVELLTRLGQREEAEKLRQLTRLLYPDWDASEATEEAWSGYGRR